jgi:homogentisate phytyltransferase/homogentisate geranylgeranyltransferase
LINHIYDIEIDKVSGVSRITTENLLSIPQVQQIAIVFAMISILFSALLDYQVLVLTLIALIVGTIYSIPPFRLRNRIFSSLFIGAGSVIAFFIGIATPFDYGRGIKTMNPEIFPVAVVIFFALSVGTVIKDFKDFKGDKKREVRTIFTVYGEKTGLDISSLLLFISFISPLLLFHMLRDFMVILPIGLVTTFLFRKFKRVELTFCIYFIMFFYLLIRWFSVI